MEAFKEENETFKKAENKEELKELKEVLLESLSASPSAELLAQQQELLRQNEQEAAKEKQEEILPRIKDFVANYKNSSVAKSTLKRGLILMSKISDESQEELVQSFKENQHYLEDEAKKYCEANNISFTLYKNFRSFFISYIKFIDGDFSGNTSFELPKLEEFLKTCKYPSPIKSMLKRGLEFMQELSGESLEELIQKFRENKSYLKDEAEKYSLENNISKYTYSDFKGAFSRYIRFIDSNLVNEEVQAPQNQESQVQEQEESFEEDFCESPEEEIQESNKKLFLSYASKDMIKANKICKNLRENGHDVWFALDSIKPGQNYAAEIVKAIDECTHIVFVLSTNSNASEHVQKELELAINCGKILYPIRIEDFSPFGYLRYHLSTIQYVDVFDDFEGGMELINMQLQ